MTKLPVLILLISSVVPTLLAGHPVYHCMITGSHRLAPTCGAGGSGVLASADDECSCCCAADESVRESTGTESTGTETTAPQPSGDGRGFSSTRSCCQISMIQLDIPRLRSDTEVESAPIVHSPATIEFGASRSNLDARRTVDTVRPPGSPPLFLLHSAYLI